MNIIKCLWVNDTFTVTVENVAPAVSVDIPEQTVQYSDPIQDVTIAATDVPADVMSATVSYVGPGPVPFVPGLPDAGTIGGGLSLVGDPYQVETGEWRLIGIADLAPGTYIIRVAVSDEDSGSTDVDITINVLQEDAYATYNGVEFVSTPSDRDSVAIVELRAVIQDVTAVSPALDPDSGHISYATVSFVIRETGEIIPGAEDIPVELIDGDIMTGSVTFDWVVDLGTKESESFTIGIIVDGFYARDSSVDDTVVTVSMPVQNSITGGGYLINESSEGIFAGDTDLKTNFGFNVKFNKKLTNLQGHMNIIIRQGDSVYQIKTNATRSLVADPMTNQATFVSKANLTDITDPYNPISLGGNLSLVVTLTDMGSPGTFDSIGVTLWKRNTLWFSSNWTGNKTIEQVLGGGNLVIHHAKSISQTTGSKSSLETVSTSSLSESTSQMSSTDLMTEDKSINLDTLPQDSQNLISHYVVLVYQEDTIHDLLSNPFELDLRSPQEKQPLWPILNKLLAQSGSSSEGLTTL
jgi:hypothetical protein